MKRYEVSPGRQILYSFGLLLVLLGFLSFLSVFVSGALELASDPVSRIDSIVNPPPICNESKLPASGKRPSLPPCGSLGHGWASFVANPFLRAPIGMGMIILGIIVAGIGSAGMAGSGMVLNPRQARQDLEPLNRAAGGMVQDTLEEIPALQGVLGGQEVIKVRCQNCQALNDETDKFCGQCGKPL